MKGLITAATLIFFFGSCKESGVQLSKPSTFVKYFSDGNQNEAIDILETSDKGYIILSHSDSSKGVGGINITKTDLSGNRIWEKYIRSASGDLVPSNFVAMKDISGNDLGYVIVGTLKYPSLDSTELFVWRIKNEGTSMDSRFYARDSSSYKGYVIGKGVAQSGNSTNDIFVVGQLLKKGLLSGPPQDPNGNLIDMFFAQINGTSLDTVFTRKYGGGTTNLANRLYLDYSQSSAYWGGTRTDDQGIHMRFVKSGFNSQNPIFDLPYPIGDSGYTGNDFCAYGYGFAFIGNHTGQEIAVAKVSSEGNLLDTLKFHLKSGLPFVGNSICSTLDGGLLILGSASVDIQGTNTDYYLIKVDATRNKQWEIAQGGKYPDVGVRVLQSSDGGYIVLGTTTLANVKTVFLMKTDSRGNIE